MMQRLTTDNPTSNLSSLLNIAYAGEDGRVKLRYADGQEDADLCELMAEMIAKDGGCLCKPTADHILDGCCLDCDCEYGYLYAAATQAAELRARLMMIEDILGEEYDLSQIAIVQSAILGAGLVLVIYVFKRSIPANSPPMVYDFDYTDGVVSLRSMLGVLNADGYEIISVTQNGDRFTIIFRRPMYG